MTFLYADEEYTLPDSLHQIELQKHISWNLLYGADLAERKKAADAIENKDERELAQFAILLEQASKCISVYTGIPLVEVEEHISIGSVMNAFHASNMMWAVQEHDVEVEDVYTWNDASWAIQPVFSEPPTEISFNQFMAIKKIALSVLRLSNGDWSGMVAVCAAHFRQVDEPFNTAFLEESNERYELIKTLPMDYALAVAKYVATTLKAYNDLLAQHMNDNTHLGPEIPEE